MVPTWVQTWCRNTGGKGYLPAWSWHSAHLWTRGPQGTWCRSDTWKTAKAALCSAKVRAPELHTVSSQASALLQSGWGAPEGTGTSPVKHPQKTPEIGSWDFGREKSQALATTSRDSHS